MMKMVIKGLGNPIDISGDAVNVLSVEHPGYYYETVNLLYSGGSEIYCSSVNGTNGQTDCEVVLSPFLIDFQGKKITQLLYKKIEQEFVVTNDLERFNILKTQVTQFVSELSQNINAHTALDEDFAMADILKLCNVHIDCGGIDLVSKVIDYISIVLELKKVSLFVFIGLKGYLTEEDERQILQHCKYQEVSLMLVEPKLANKFDFEKITVVDEDLCDFIESS